MQSSKKMFNLHGDNIVECDRAFNHLVEGFGDEVVNVVGPNISATCPVYVITLTDRQLQFQFFPGYGKHRWNQDILNFVRHSGGRLREAADVIVTAVENEEERALAAIEFCSALPAGNQAWQRHGRAFSFAYADIPYFFVTEIGGFELGSDRGRKSTRMPNPTTSFSFYSMTAYSDSICLPVYGANAGATDEITEIYGAIFGKFEFLKFLQLAILNKTTDHLIKALGEKCVAFTKLLADSRRRKDGLTGEQWEMAYKAISKGESLPDFLIKNAQVPWAKKVYISSITKTARQFIALGEQLSLGLTSSALPLSFVPKEKRVEFSRETRTIYPDASDEFVAMLANTDTHLVIAWVTGFKPGGEDSRPDRGLPPLARMLAGEDCELITFVYGPAPKAHWDDLATDPSGLATRNGLWGAIMAVSNGVLIDSATKPDNTPRAYLKKSWATILRKKREPLRVEAKVRQFGEQDVDTALHVAFKLLGTGIAFEGMCNPPGGDWSGISFRWGNEEPEFRWLTLPRVSGEGTKRPDHVFAIFGYGNSPVCLCIESKENARLLGENIGQELIRYTESLFKDAPSIYRIHRGSPWEIYKEHWNSRKANFVSAGAYLSNAENPFGNLSEQTSLAIQIGVAFSEDGKKCTLHMRGETEEGRDLVRYLGKVVDRNNLVEIVANN